MVHYLRRRKWQIVFSVSIFVVYSLVVTIATYAGDPIDCKSNTQTPIETNFLDK